MCQHGCNSLGTSTGTTGIWKQIGSTRRGCQCAPDMDAKWRSNVATRRHMGGNAPSSTTSTSLQDGRLAIRGRSYYSDHGLPQDFIGVARRNYHDTGEAHGRGAGESTCSTRSVTWDRVTSTSACGLATTGRCGDRWSPFSSTWIATQSGTQPDCVPLRLACLFRCSERRRSTRCPAGGNTAGRYDTFPHQHRYCSVRSLLRSLGPQTAEAVAHVGSRRSDIYDDWWTPMWDVVCLTAALARKPRRPQTSEGWQPPGWSYLGLAAAQNQRSKTGAGGKFATTLLYFDIPGADPHSRYCYHGAPRSCRTKGSHHPTIDLDPSYLAIHSISQYGLSLAHQARILEREITKTHGAVDDNPSHKWESNLGMPGGLSSQKLPTSSTTYGTQWTQYLPNSCPQEISQGSMPSDCGCGGEVHYFGSILILQQWQYTSGGEVAKRGLLDLWRLRGWRRGLCGGQELIRCNQM